MTVSNTAKYALRAAVWLASKPGEPQTTQQISAGTNVSAKYLPKVLQPLARAGYVAGQRGVHGGYALACEPAKVSVLEVLACVEPVGRMDACVSQTHAGEQPQQAVTRLLNDALSTMRDRFASVTLAMLLQPSEVGLKGTSSSNADTYRL
jgi:Rrf2 family transcriptional regulator, nitric oxide-sensitive transcriptional repressor